MKALTVKVENEATAPIHLLKSGKPAHRLTTEDRRRGGLAAAAKAREAGKTALDKARELVEQQAHLLIAPYLDAMEKGDWRAAEALMSRIYGTPTSRVETADVSELKDVTLDDALKLLAETRARLEEQSGT